MNILDVNKNSLTKPRFKFVCTKIPQTIYFCQAANIPGISVGEYAFETPLKVIPTPGDKLVYEDLTLRFVVNEDLNNWIEIKNWLSDIGFDSELSSSNAEWKNLFAEGTLFILSDKMNSIGKITFEDMWPVSLGNIEFDITSPDNEIITTDVTFKYTKYSYTSL